MEKEDMKLLNNFLSDERVEELESEEVKKLASKIAILNKQILLQEQYNKDLQATYEELDKLIEKKK